MKDQAMNKPTEKMIEAAMTSLFGEFNNNSNHHAWVTPNWKQARLKVSDALSAAMSVETVSKERPMPDVLDKLKALAPHPVWSEAAAEITHLRSFVERLQQRCADWAASYGEKSSDFEALTAALAVEAGTVGVIMPDHCSGSALTFEGGCLHVRKDGSGYIVVDEDDFTLEDDRCEGEHGPEGSVHWIARFPAGEMTALRDFLNGQGFSSTTTSPASSGVEGEAVAWRSRWADEASWTYSTEKPDHHGWKVAEPLFAHPALPAAPSLSAGAGGAERG